VLLLEQGIPPALACGQSAKLRLTMSRAEMGNDRELDTSNLVSRIETILADASGLSPRRIREVVAPAALLLFLRWLDQRAGRQATDAVSKGSDYRAASKEVRWKTIRDLRGKQLSRHRVRRLGGDTSWLAT
jgi:hypothetical protein